MSENWHASGNESRDLPQRPMCASDFIFRLYCLAALSPWLDLASMLGYGESVVYVIMCLIVEKGCKKHWNSINSSVLRSPVIASW